MSRLSRGLWLLQGEGGSEDKVQLHTHLAGSWGWRPQVWPVEGGWRALSATPVPALRSTRALLNPWRFVALARLSGPGHLAVGDPAPSQLLAQP